MKRQPTSRFPVSVKPVPGIIFSLSLSLCTYAQVGLTIDRSFSNSDQTLVSDLDRTKSFQSHDTIPAILSVVHLGRQPKLPEPFFCHIESQIQKKSGLALRFRLGSLDYVNWLEGKYEPLTDLTRE